MWRRCGLSCLLLLLSKLAVAETVENCFPDTQKRNGEASVSLSFKFRGGCSKGLVVIESNTPSAGAQVLVQSFELPITNVWFEDMDGDSDPDLMLQTTKDASAGRLMVFRNQQGRLVHQWLAEPDELQRQGYLQRDRLYVRWGKLVRLLRYQSGAEELWRRLVYNFDARRWEKEQ